MKRATETAKWKDPVKGIPPSAETMAIEGDFETFTAFMEKLMNVPPQREKGKPNLASPCHDPDASS
jgi:hypothetical protein